MHATLAFQRELHVDRRCAVCEVKVPPHETYRFGLTIVHRYRCAGCGRRFDVATPFGEVLLTSLGVTLVATVSLSPDRKFSPASARWWILAIVLGLLLVTVVHIKKSRNHAKMNPPWQDE